ncbi:MAG TPA: hemerythrin domain-containing protein [Jatrophihabitantaceae bacterium]|nr:hemerythrin domain-containing protein [Jatrophihabitantaceae bacterium]
MAADRSMNVIIHAAFKRDMSRFEDALARFPAGSTARAAELGRAWQFFTTELHHHHESEETLFFEAFRELGGTDQLVTELKGEHADLIIALDTADAAMRALGEDPTTEHAATARNAVTKLHETFETHIAHEERESEPLLLNNLDAPALKRAEKQVRREQGLVGGGRFLAWLQDGGTADNAAALRATIPRPVLFVFGRLVGRSYTRDIGSVWA